MSLVRRGESLRFSGCSGGDTESRAQPDGPTDRQSDGHPVRGGMKQWLPAWCVRVGLVTSLCQGSESFLFPFRDVIQNPEEKKRKLLLSMVTHLPRAGSEECYFCTMER